MVKNKIGVALIGSGRAGMIHAHNFRGSVPGAVIAAVCDPVVEAAKAAAEELELDNYYTDYKDVLALDNIDAVNRMRRSKGRKAYSLRKADGHVG